MRANPERVYRAQRAGFMQRLIGKDWSQKRGEGLAQAREAEAESRGRKPLEHQFWDGVEEWLRERGVE